MRLTKRRFDKLSDIASDIGLVALASVVLPAVLDKIDAGRVVSGLAAMMFFWVFSIWLRR